MRRSAVSVRRSVRATGHRGAQSIATSAIVSVIKLATDPAASLPGALLPICYR